MCVCIDLSLYLSNVVEFCGGVDVAQLMVPKLCIFNAFGFLLCPSVSLFSPPAAGVQVQSRADDQNDSSGHF